MKTSLKSKQVVIRTTQAQKDFLARQAELEDRSLTTVVNIALGEKYPEYQKITKGKGE